jgi:hypothetical protein
MKRTRSVAVAKIPAAPPASDWSALPREMVREVGSHLDLVSLFCLARATRDNFDTLVSLEATSRFARFIPDPAQWDRAIAPFLRPLYLDHEALLTMEPAYFRVVKRLFCEPAVRLHSSEVEKAAAGNNIDLMISCSIANCVNPATDDKYQRLCTLINRYVVPSEKKNREWSHCDYFLLAFLYCNIPFLDWLRTEPRWAFLDEWKLGVGPRAVPYALRDMFNFRFDVLPACTYNPNGLQVLTAFVDLIITMDCCPLFWRTDCFWATIMSAKHVTLAQLKAFFESPTFQVFKDACWVASNPIPILLHPFQFDLSNASDLARYTLMLEYIPEQYLVGLTYSKASYVEFLAACANMAGFSDIHSYNEVYDRLHNLNARPWISISPKDFLCSSVLSLFLAEDSKNLRFFTVIIGPYSIHKGRTFMGDDSVLERPFKALSSDCQRVAVQHPGFRFLMSTLFGNTSTVLLMEDFCKWGDIEKDRALTEWIDSERR